MEERIGELRNHYVPKFILKNFVSDGDSGVSCFNPKTGEFLHNRTPESIYYEVGIYTNELERKFNDKIECAFSQMLRKLLNRDSISLRRKDLWMIKRFLLIETLRTPETLSYVKKFRKIMKKCAAYSPEYSRLMYGKHIDDIESKETDTEYWLRTLDFVLEEEEFTTDAVDRNEKGTALAHYWTLAFTAGYIGFWDSPGTDEFIITDVGFTSETELGWTVECSQVPTKIKMITDLIEKVRNKDPDLDLNLIMLLRWMSAFGENIYMFPISSKRMIVLINPFFKFVINNAWMFPWNTLDVITAIPDKRLFNPNESSCNMIGEHKEDDIYTYLPVELHPDQVLYCNALFLDRVENWVGFGSMKKMKRSVLNYKENNRHCRNDYTILLDILRKSKSGIPRMKID